MFNVLYQGTCSNGSDVHGDDSDCTNGNLGTSVADAVRGLMNQPPHPELEFPRGAAPARALLKKLNLL